jgi:hypothetical protein
MREELYKLMAQVLGPLDSLPDAATYKAKGYMDLHLDVLMRSQHEVVIALSHTYQQNGDTVPDPDMQFLVCLDNHPETPATVRSQSFQNVVTYTHVSGSDSAKQETMVTRSLDSFALMWLRNLVLQGHAPSDEGLAQ